jgi:hypothetical protein
MTYDAHVLDVPAPAAVYGAIMPGCTPVRTRRGLRRALSQISRARHRVVTGRGNSHIGPDRA